MYHMPAAVLPMCADWTCSAHVFWEVLAIRKIIPGTYQGAVPGNTGRYPINCCTFCGAGGC